MICDGGTAFESFASSLVGGITIFWDGDGTIMTIIITTIETGNRKIVRQNVAVAVLYQTPHFTLKDRIRKKLKMGSSSTMGDNKR